MFSKSSPPVPVAQAASFPSAGPSTTPVVVDVNEIDDALSTFGPPWTILPASSRAPCPAMGCA